MPKSTESDDSTLSINLDKFTKGKNNVAKETSLPEGSLRDAINVDVDNVGNTRRREGYTLLYSGLSIDSLYKRYFREANKLKYLNTDNTATIIADVTSLISYMEVNNLIYCTDGNTNLILKDTTAYSLGIPTPKIIGQEPESGDIQTTYTYRNTLTREESGAARGMVNSSSFPKQGYDLIQWNTTGNDGRFYDSSGRILETQFMDILPAGQIIEYYKGRVYVAKGSTLWYSEPHRYGLTKLATNFFNFPSHITICIAVDSGIYVVADKTYFINFSKTEEARIKEVSQDTGVEGTGLLVPGNSLGFDFEEEIAYWISSKGAILGLPDGRLHDLTKKVLAISNNSSEIGSSLYREYNSIKQIISSMPVGGEISKLGSSDSATLTVIRNGIEI